ncbi:O-antigen ligase family protein [Mesorhizobium sp.]|uniref:O-antigen ligase family protein n=1 Tax=Mesorhizobium sp. TaxID=1871066 RepID=UPI001206F9BB|nr:O-antigen ligase family protein [Mesorhizobium sp.]TIV56940.1 MAG: O-antigen ligase family protein [Mesorhizobium sp.]
MKSLSSLRRHLTPTQTNIYFSIVCFLSPVLGSAVSVAFNAGGACSVLLVALRRRQFNFDRPMLAMTASIYAYCAAMVLASTVNGALGADLKYFLPLITLLFFPISYSTWSSTDKVTLARIAVLASAATCCGALAIAIVQYHWIGTRAEGGAGNAIVFATVTCLAVMMCLAGALSGIVKDWKLLAVAALAGAVAIIYSESRMIWVAMLIAIIAILLINRHRFMAVSLTRLAIVTGAACLVVAALGFPIIAGRADFLFSDWDALTARGDYNTALGLRVAMWEIGLGAFREMPIFGHGISASRTLMKQGFHDQFGMAAGFNHYHSGFLTALVQAGAVGALALAAIFVVATRNATKVLRLSGEPVERFGATMLIVTVITYLIGGMTGIIIGHDILDSVLMVFMISGTYLACGRTVSPMGKCALGVVPLASHPP